MSDHHLNKLVDEITREVLVALSRRPGMARGENGTVIVVLTRPGQSASSALQTLSRKADEVLVASASEVSSLPKVTRLHSEAEAEGRMTRASFVLIPTLTFQDLYNLASGTSLGYPLSVAESALRQGLPVYLAREGLEEEGKSSPDLLRLLELRGLKIIRLSDLEGMASCAVSPCSALTGECDACGYCPVKIEGKVDRVVKSGASRIGGTLGMPPVRQDLAPLIDHTLLKPEATRPDILKLCEEARQHRFASVCVNPSWVSLCAEQLRGSDVKVCTVVGFPLGATTTLTKVIETRDAIANGADEIDMVINVGALKAKQDELVLNDIHEVRKAAGNHLLKVILETALLDDEEKVRACVLAKQAGADFVKTSTGFGPGGATVHDIMLMRQTVGHEMGVKASGGIRDTETALKMVEAGATRIGASASVAIVKGVSAGQGKY